MNSEHRTVVRYKQPIKIEKPLECSRRFLAALRSAHTMGLVPATSPCNKSQGLVASCELATSPCNQSQGLSLVASCELATIPCD